MTAKFELVSKFEPAGDQPKAIKELVAGFREGKACQTLLGATGTGKTFTASNVIAQIGKPTLVLAHNKTLAAQLYKEFERSSHATPSIISSAITTTINPKPTFRSATSTSKRMR